jgi:hypothetical protein
MKLLEILLIVVLVVVLIHINKDDKLSVSDKLVDPVKPINDNIISVSEEDILIENRGDPVKTTGNFPIPQSTTTSKSLSTNYPEDLSIITNGATIPNKDTVNIVRSATKPLQESHFPEYYRKDNLSGNTIDTSEYKFAEVDNLKSSHAWSDENVSQYPNYYTSQLKDEITNVGAFFDVNNNFVDTTKPRSTANVGDICFVSKEGEKVCLDNKNQYNVPPSLISDKSNCGFLNSIGLLEFSNLVNESKERVNNGGYLYGSVKGSKKHNEVYSEPIQQQVLQCQI